MKVSIQKADLVKPRVDHGILFIDESDNLLKLKTLDALIVFNPNSNPGTEPSPEEPTLLNVSGCDKTWLNGEYTKIATNYNDKPVYAIETYNSTISENVVAFLYFNKFLNKWTLSHSPLQYVTNKDELNILLSGNGDMHPDTFIEDLGFVGCNHYTSTSDVITGPWEGFEDDESKPVISFPESGTSVPPQESIPTTYVVEGSNWNEVNGEYIDSGKTINNNPVYITNSSNYAIILFNHGGSLWSIRNISNYSKNDLLNVSDNELSTIWLAYSPLFISDSITGTWETATGSGNITVTLKVIFPEPEVPEDPDVPSNEDEEVVPEGVTAYVVSNAGTEWLNGTYIDTGRLFVDDSIYAREVTNADGVKCLALLWSNGAWNLTSNTSISTIAEFKEVGDPVEILSESDTMFWYFNDATSTEITGTWTTNMGAAPAPTVTLYENKDVESEQPEQVDGWPGNAAFRLIGAGDPTINGYYYATDELIDNKPVYKNENNAIAWESSRFGFVYFNDANRFHNILNEYGESELQVEATYINSPYQNGITYSETGVHDPNPIVLLPGETIESKYVIDFNGTKFWYAGQTLSMYVTFANENGYFLIDLTGGSNLRVRVNGQLYIWNAPSFAEFDESKMNFDVIFGSSYTSNWKDEFYNNLENNPVTIL